MFEEINDIYSLFYTVIAAVDAEISLLVLGLGLLYCIVGIVSLKATGAQVSYHRELAELRAEVQRLSERVLVVEREARATPLEPSAQEAKVEEAPVVAAHPALT